MPLRVWLPLLGNLDNQGLDDLIVTNNGATIDTAGKLGKCYCFNNTAAIVTHLNVSPFVEHFSFCGWVKFTSTTSAQYIFHLGGATWQSKYALSEDYSGTIVYYIDGTENRTTLSTASTLNQWVHYAYTYDGSTVRIYVNGELGYSVAKSSASFSYSDNLSFGARVNNSAGTAFAYGMQTGYLNDVRLYDNCLSAKAIKEIAKGLVCHYTLGDKPCDNILTNSTGYNGTTDWGGVISTATENGIPYLISQRTNTTSTSRTFVSHSAITSYVSSWSAGDKFTISGYYRVPSSETYAVSANLFIRWTFADSSFSDTGFSTPSASTVVKDTWIRFEYTYTVPANYTDGAVNFYLSAFSQGLSTVHWKYVKLEKGDRATPWLPNSSDAEYTTMGYNSTTVYDCSGYNYHGAINTTMSVSSNTSRYSVSTNFNGTDNCITIPFNTMCPTNIFTMNIWFYKDALGSKNYETLVGGPSGFEMDTRAGTATTLSLYMASTRGSTLYSPLEFNMWNMITMVRDGTNEYYYVNGDLKKTITAKSMPTGTYFIGAWNTKTSQNYYGLMSDFRLYSTCLSADNILELYHTGATIDRSGNMYAYEFSEV